MSLCEGRSNCPCPSGVNDKSVKLIQGDLMLCPLRNKLFRLPTKKAMGSQKEAVNAKNITKDSGDGDQEAQKKMQRKSMQT